MRRVRPPQYIRANALREGAYRPCRLLGAAAAALALSACSMSLPIASLKDGDDAITTGSVNTPAAAAQLSATLSGEDWRRAQAALGVAVDPQGNGAPVTWDNPESGRKGSFVPAGPLYVVDNRICRSFIATLQSPGPDQQLHGSTCRNGPNDWIVREAKPWKG